VLSRKRGEGGVDRLLLLDDSAVQKWGCADVRAFRKIDYYHNNAREARYLTQIEVWEKRIEG
jgi:hypothetical protein